MATARLFDANLSGYIEFETLDSPDDLQDYWAERCGIWTESPDNGGAILTGDSWEIMYFRGTLDADDFDAYPDFLISETGIEMC